MKTRIISGVIGALIAVLVLALYDTLVFPLAVAVLACVSLYELFRAGKCMHCRISVAAGFLYGLLIPFLTYYDHGRTATGVTILCLMAMFLELVVLHKQVRYPETFFVAAATLLVTNALTMLVRLLQVGSYGLAYVILALCSAWISDTGAYFTGTFCGKHKLCPEVSPKKTVEGFFGGIVADVLVMVIFALIYSLVTDVAVHYLWLIVTAIICAAVGVLGDLSASILKRQVGIKDYGNIMPGHGGVMDRFDSVLFTLPAFYAMECVFPIFYV